MSNNDNVFDYYTKLVSNDDEKTALCNLCDKTIRYTSTIHNLKTHLTKHKIFLSKRKISRPSTKRTKFSLIWSCFSAVEGNNKLARCNKCNKNFSYKTTSSNLRSHLRRHHPTLLQRLIREQDKSPRSSESAGDDDDASERSAMETEYIEQTDEETSRSPVWIYFERHEHKQGRARCAVCCATVPSAVKDLREHLKQKHPKLLAELAPDSEQEDNDPDEMYTEIVYLEEPITEEKHTKDRRATFSSRNERAYANKTASRVTTKRKSTYKPDVVSPKQVSQYSENVRRNTDVDELDSFGNYVTCLLKKLPRDVSMNLQRDIINLIMNVKLNKVEKEVEKEKKIVLDGNILRTSEGSNYYLISNKKENGASDRQDCVAVTALENHSYSIVNAEDKEKQEKSCDSDPNESS